MKKSPKKKPREKGIITEGLLKREALRLPSAHGCQRPGQGCVGVEFETMGLLHETCRAVPFYGPVSVQRVLAELESTYHWKADRVGDFILSLERDSQHITVEPGGQIELSTPPAESAMYAKRAEERHLEELNAIGKKLGIFWSGLAMQPISSIASIDWHPKERYQIMRRYFEKRGTLGHSMMKGTASVQVALDYFSEDDARVKLRLAMRLAPIAVAIFANSCLAEGKLSGYKSFRSHIWQHTDPTRCGIVEAVFKEDFGFEDWVEYVLDVPVFFIERKGHLIGPVNKTFRQYMKSGYKGHAAEPRDWTLHLTCLFPEVRLREYIEFRSCDRQSGDLAYAPAVLFKTIFYNVDVLRGVDKLLKRWDASVCREGLRQAAKLALDGEVVGRELKDWAREIFAIIGQSKLDRLDKEEREILEGLKQRVIVPGLSPADHTIRAFQSKKNLLSLIRTSAI